MDFGPGTYGLGYVAGILTTLSPCVLPLVPIVIATALASQGQNIAQISLLMLIFGLGASTPLVALGTVSRESMARIRGRMLSAGKLGKSVLGGLLIVVGVAILSGLDKSFEAWVVGISPQWLNDLTTRN